jgi:hypothetical protein
VCGVLADQDEVAAPAPHRGPHDLPLFSQIVPRRTKLSFNASQSAGVAPRAGVRLEGRARPRCRDDASPAAGEREEGGPSAVGQGR